MSAIPQVPPRPTRSEHQQSLPKDTPQIPPRPTRHVSNRSPSPNPENFQRSPFHEQRPPSANMGGSGDGNYLSISRNQSSTDLPQRPPSVSLPSVGQEGSEYADIVYNPAEDDTTAEGEVDQSEPKETRNVAGDLPLHAPKPSLSDSTAKNRVSAVTRTDSTQAAAAGLGKAPTPTAISDDPHHPDHFSRNRVSFRSTSSASTERPTSERPPSAMIDDEHGIPEIGQRVPMYPDAGDVQAPSPSPLTPQFPVGIGFHNSGTSKPAKHHRRTPSGREVLPPGSYGMHGHGVSSTDQFEKEWYAKHPDALAREEHGEYGPGIGGGRGEWAMSSDDLNKLVYDTAKAAKQQSSVPNEQIGYEASEGYTSRGTAPGTVPLKMMHSNSSQPHVESPLRKSSFPVDPDAGAVLQKTRSYDRWKRRSSEVALESETEDESLHIKPPPVRMSKYTGNGYDPPTEDLGPDGGNTEAGGGFIEERGYGVPILASDEVAKTPGAEFQQPAISPAQERRGSGLYTPGDFGEYSSHRISRPGSATNSRPSSRPASRPGSISGLSRFTTHDDERDMHTPLEDVDEYEPLFPDDEGNSHRKAYSAAERMKLREQMKRFPSQDVWEDTPTSLQLEATVETPEEASAKAAAAAASKTFETPEQESARKGEPSEEEKAKLIPAGERLAKSNFKPHIQEEVDRPSMRQRFPSRDIWEDSPDSAHLETVLVDKPTDAGLEAGAVVSTTGRPKDGVLEGQQPRDGATAGSAAIEKPTIPQRPNKYKMPPPPLANDGGKDEPKVPARPQKRVYQVPPADAQVPIVPSKLSREEKATSPTEGRKVHGLPDRPKPQIPARPTKPGQTSTDSPPLSKVTSASSVGGDGQADKEATIPKAKPAVPARPTGSKIANLKAGFLGDLESRLKLGPQAPKPQEKEIVEPEAEEEKAPLSDARRGRAKGPSKRKPASTPTAAGAEDTGKALWGIQTAWTVWETDEGGEVVLKSSTAAPAASKQAPAASSTQKARTEEGDVAQTNSSAEQADELKAKLAVEESIQASEAAAPATADTPGNTDLATPAFEAERNPLSKDPPTPVSSPPSAIISPEPTTTSKVAAPQETGELAASKAAEESTVDGGVKLETVSGGDDKPKVGPVE